MFKNLFKILQPGALLLTANRRLASWVAHEHSKFQLLSGNYAWESIDVLPYQNWLQRCFSDLQAQGIGQALTLLNTNQEQEIWQNIIRQQTDDALLSITATALTAQQAWQLLQQWRISYDNTQLTTTVDGTSLAKWAQAFIEQCQKNNLLDQARLTEFINKHISNHNLVLPKQVILIGFIEITPVMQKLLDTLANQGCKINNYENNQQNYHNKTFRLALDNIENEIYTMAQWAKNMARNNKKNLVGCIVPNINEHRNTIEIIFREVFNTNNAYNISSGRKFSDESIIYVALEILRLTATEISIFDFGYVLRSTYIAGNEDDYLRRTLLDALIRQCGKTRFRLTDLIKIIETYGAKNELQQPLILAQLTKLNDAKFTRNQSPSQWAKTFSTQLAIIGWPGDRKLNRRETLATERWQNLLEELAQLDLVIASCSYLQALGKLTQMAAQILFQPETAEFAPIQILGMLEATGLSFTHTWIMNMDDKHWPAPAKPNPFIPTFLQRQLDMPHSSAEREYNFSYIMTKQFMHNSTEVIFSYSTTNHDEQLQPSPLIKDIPQLDDATLFSQNDDERLLLKGNNNLLTHNDTFSLSSANKCLSSSCSLTTKSENINFETITDNIAPTITANEAINSSVAIFKLQAACPFMAFAQFRLHAHELAIPQEGIAATDRGLFIHKILELLWKQIKTQQTLTSLTDTELTEIINSAINTAGKIIFSKTEIKQGIQQLEKQRLQKVIFNWLQLEKIRPPFSVAELEKKYKICFKNFSINVRIDRIDKLANGDYILIDYKSGKVHISAWFGENPDDPQMPIYAINLGKPISALAFAQINPAELQFKTISKEKDLLPQCQTLTDINFQGAETSWQKQFATWKQTTEKLASDFCQGKAHANPKDPANTCKYCQLHTLCRIYEKN